MCLRAPRMHMACRGGHLDVCKWLYDRGAHEYVCLEDPDSQTPLHCAAACGRLDLCQWLVKHGAAQCVNVVATYGMTPLAEACSSGNLDLCEWLVDECGALLQPTDAKLMAEAARRGHVPVMAWLCERGLGSTVTMETDENNTPLHHACGGHHLSAVEFLYNHGARQCITEPNSLDQTPLHKCCASPSRSSSPVCAGAEVAEWLCTHGAEECVHLGDRIGRTPLHVAYMQSSVDVCEALYRHGAIDTVSEHNNWRNWTPLSEDVRGWFVRRFGNSMSERALAVAFSSFMRGHAKLQMKVDRVRVRADQRADHGGGDDGSDEADLLQLQQREQRVTADALAVLELGGPCVVTQCVPVKASDAILGAAVRRGVPLQFLEPHPRLRGLVAEAVLCRSAFVSAFLFGCRKSSGSTCLWRIGSRYAMAGFRKDIAEYCGVVMDAAEWLRMKQAHFELLRPGSSASRLRRKRQQRH